MEIALDLNKSVEENAALYFEQSKKARKKLEGALSALEKSKLKLKNIDEKKPKQKVPTRAAKREWYEKFRWFFSSEGFLCIGGRDATSNEILIKKHMDSEDIVFHADISGSPFFLIKTKGKKPSSITLEEVAQATASYSRGWKMNLITVDVYYVQPNQVSKKAQTGEYMGKGSFMIRGKKNYLHPTVGIAIGVVDEKIVGGPVSAIIANSNKFTKIVQGKDKTSTIAKKVRSLLGLGVVDDIIRFLPAGGCAIEK